MLSPNTSFTELVIPELILETLSINGIFCLNLKYPYAISISINTKKSGIAIIKILPYCSIFIVGLVICFLNLQLGFFILYFFLLIVKSNKKIKHEQSYFASLFLFQNLCPTKIKLSPHSIPLPIIANTAALIPLQNLFLQCIFLYSE